jgi:hypothetical protein
MIWLKTPCIESGLVKQENIRVALIYLLVSLIQSNPKRSNINHTLLSFQQKVMVETVSVFLTRNFKTHHV